LANARNELLGDYKEVGRGLRVDIANRQAMFILVENVRGNFPVDDFFKNCAHATGELGLFGRPYPQGGKIELLNGSFILEVNLHQTDAALEGR